MTRQPYKFLDAYAQEDEEIFFGRESEIQDIYSRLFLSNILVIYGSSGIGKTSILKCGITNLFNKYQRSADWKPIFIRRKGNIVHAIHAKLNEVARKPLKETQSVSDKLESVYRDYFIPIYLIFDQFEELFIFGDEKEKDDFVQELARILKIQNIKVILSIREEYLAHLNRFEKVIPRLFENRIRIEKISREDAIKVIEEPCKVCGIGIEHGLSEKIVDGLIQASASGAIELTDLQILMDRLYKSAIEKNSDAPMLSHADLNKIGDMSNLMPDFLKDRLAEMKNVGDGEAVLKRMITTEGTRKAVKIEDIAADLISVGKPLSDQNITEILQYFVATRIIGDRNDAGFYELRHDSLAKHIYERMTALEKDILSIRNMLDSRYHDRETLGLLDAEILERIEPYLKRLTLSRSLKTFIEDSKRELQKKKRRMFAIAGTAIAIFVILGIFGYIKSVESGIREQGLSDARHNLGFFLAEKAERAIGNKDFNAARLYYLHAVDHFKDKKIPDEKKPLTSIISNTPDFPILFSFSSPKADIRCMNFSGGKLIAGAVQDKTLRIWDVKTGTEKQKISSDDIEIFSLNSDKAAVVHKDKTIHIWDIATGIEKPVFNYEKTFFDYEKNRQPNIKTEDLSIPKSFDISSDGEKIALGMSDGAIYLSDITKKEVIKKLIGHRGTVMSVRFSPDGTMLASASEDMTIRLWNTDTAEDHSSKMVFQENSEINSLCFSPDGQTLASGYKDKTIRIWDIETGKKKAVILGDSDIVSLSGDGKELASMSTDKILIRNIEDIHETTKRKKKLQGHTNLVSTVVFSPTDEKILASGSWDNTIRLWNVETGKIKMLSGHRDYVISICFSPDGKMLASSSADKTISLWNVSNGKENKLFLTGKNINSVCFSPNGKTLASGSEDNTIILWDIETDTKRLLQGHESSVKSVSFSPDGKKILASGSEDNTIRLWDITTDREIAVFQGHSNLVSSVCFSPDGKTLASGSWDNTIRLWDIETRKEKSILLGHEEIISSVAFSPDGKMLISGSWDNTVRLWDVGTGKEKDIFYGHTDYINTVGFSKDGKTIASGSDDKTIRLWNMTASETLPKSAKPETIKDAERKYGLKLINMELQPVEPENR